MHNARKRLVIVSMVLAIAAAGARPATADPVDTANWVTSGSYATESGQDFFTFIGPFGRFDQTSGATPDKVWASTCTACTAGDTVNMSFRNPPLDANGFTRFVELGSGHAQFVNHPDESVRWTGSLKFMAVPIAFPDTTMSMVTVDTPFGFRGWLDGWTSPNGGFGTRVRGLGTATQLFQRDGNVYRAIGNPTYTFNAVTPEPSSLLLLGTGLVALGRRLRRRF